MDFLARLIDEVSRPQSKLHQKILKIIKQSLLNRLRPHNLPDWQEFTVSMATAAQNDTLTVSITVEHPSVRIVRAPGKVYGKTSFYFTDMSWRSAKDHFERTIAQQGVQAIMDILFRPRDKSFIGIDCYLYDHLRPWLDNGQILEFTKSFRPTQYKVCVYPAAEVVARINMTNKAMVISGKFPIGPKVTYDEGEVYLNGKFPIIMADSLVGRSVHSVIEADAFKDRGNILQVGRQQTKLRLVIERETVSMAELSRRAREEQGRAITHAIYAIA